MNERRFAFLSVWDKTGIVEFAHGLKELGFEILSAGATARTLKQAELEIRELPVPEGLPHLLREKVRTLSPDLFAAILVDRGNGPQVQALERRGLGPVDLVAVNLYPLAEVVQSSRLPVDEVLEYVDVGSSAVLRAAARNFPRVIVVSEPADYNSVLASLNEIKDVSLDYRQRLAVQAFYSAAYYDSTVAQFLAGRQELLPEEMVMALKKVSDLPYGENPQQRAALYGLSGSRAWGTAAASLLHGKPLTFNHYVDLEAAGEMTGEFQEPACVIFKHGHPCGAAAAERLEDAARRAFQADPQSARGGIAAFNRELDEETARFLAEEYLECLLAPGFSQGALDVLRLKRDLRLVTVPSRLAAAGELKLHSVSGGLLVEETDGTTLPAELKSVGPRPPSETELVSLRFAWKVAKHAKTHAMVLARGTQTVGIGAGQPSRFDALSLAVAKSRERHPILDPSAPLVLASDGNLPLRCVQEAARAGVSAIIQPGGSSEDKSAVQACAQRGIAMAFTGLRHYKH